MASLTGGGTPPFSRTVRPPLCQLLLLSNPGFDRSAAVSNPVASEEEGDEVALASLLALKALREAELLLEAPDAEDFTLVLVGHLALSHPAPVVGPQPGARLAPQLFGKLGREKTGSCRDMGR